MDDKKSQEGRKEEKTSQAEVKETSNPTAPTATSKSDVSPTPEDQVPTETPLKETKPKGKNLLLVGLLVLALILIGGGVWLYKTLGGKKEGVPVTGKTELVISGSGSATEFLKVIAKEYQKVDPNVEFKFLPSTGTGDGVKGVAEGFLDIGAAARPMKESEEQKYPDIKYTALFKDGFALGVNPNVTVNGLTKQQIVDIYNGKITNWNQVGGHSADIVILDREEEDSSKILLRKEVFGEDLVITDEAIELHSAGTMHETIETTENSIGHASVGVVNVYDLNIKLLAYEGVDPTQSNIQSGTYPLYRMYGIIIPISPSAKVQKFINYITGVSGKALLNQSGLVPAD